MAFRPISVAVIIAAACSAKALQTDASAAAGQSMTNAKDDHGIKANIKNAPSWHPPSVDPYFCRRRLSFVAPPAGRGVHAQPQVELPGSAAPPAAADAPAASADPRSRLPQPGADSDRAGLPKFIIIGTQKAGTTYMRNLLFTHQQLRTVCSSRTMSTEGGALVTTEASGVDAFRTAYANAMRKATFRCQKAGEFVFDNKPYYMVKTTSARIALATQALPPQTFFVLQLRDPLDRMVSAMAMESCRGGTTKNNCQLDKWIGVMDKLDNFEEMDRISSEHVSKGMYGTALKRWMEYVPQERMLVFLFEEISADPLSVANQVLSKAGLELFREIPHVKQKPSAQSSCKAKACDGPARDNISAAASDRCKRIRKFYEPEIKDLGSLVGKSAPTSWSLCKA